MREALCFLFIIESSFHHFLQKLKTNYSFFLSAARWRKSKFIVFCFTIAVHFQKNGSVDGHMHDSIYQHTQQHFTWIILGKKIMTIKTNEKLFVSFRNRVKTKCPIILNEPLLISLGCGQKPRKISRHYHCAVDASLFIKQSSTLCSCSCANDHVGEGSVIQIFFWKRLIIA